MHHNSHAELIMYMDLARIPEEGEPSVVEFTVELFKTLRYAHRERVVRTRVDIPLLICGESTHVQTDVCIVDRSHNDILLLVQTGKRLENMDPDKCASPAYGGRSRCFQREQCAKGRSWTPTYGGQSHTWYCDGWHVSCVPTNPRHPKSVHSYSPWDVSRARNLRDLLSSPCSSPTSSLQ